MIRNIFFDVGNTLLFPNRRTTLAPLHSRNVFPSEEQLRACERRTKVKFDASRGAVDQGFWQIFYSGLLEELGIADPDLLAELVKIIRVSANWCEIRPGTREILLRLAAAYRIAVISNADGKIAEVLERCGIRDCFLTITDSGIVGHEKPHPAIFAAALKSLDAHPSESLYVGDVYAVDYLGAMAAGMQAILFDAPGAYADGNLPRVASLTELEQKLEGVS